jgi:hypothetical protein
MPRDDGEGKSKAAERLHCGSDPAGALMAPGGTAMAAKMKVGDPVTLRGEVTRIEGEQITVRVSGYDYPLTLRTIFIEPVERRQAERRPSSQMGD